MGTERIRIISGDHYAFVRDLKPNRVLQQFTGEVKSQYFMPWLRFAQACLFTTKKPLYVLVSPFESHLIVNFPAQELCTQFAESL